MRFRFRFILLLLTAFLGLSAVKPAPAVAQPLRAEAPPGSTRSVVLKPAPRADHRAPTERVAEGRRLRFWPMFGASLLGGAVGGGLGLLVGDIDLDVLDSEARQAEILDGDDSDDISLAPLGVWIGAGVGAMGIAHADPESAQVLLAAGGALLLGSAMGGMVGAALTGANFWATATGFVGGAAAGASFGLWATVPPGRRSRRPALFNLGGGGDGQLRVPAVQKRIVPGTFAAGWNVPVLNARF